ncbi:TRAP transporter substrate-binding protein [Paenibacillus xerothermodurans]|uniref:C4-dicarboxylate ABC transporter substrate-binding protein n=1 Tax=Paenibacillus xerothermodurans TaxID=1977292 RepID=A0A2W1N9J6_PAEXE|nr:TRAP transporter substrate-binding protein [Paenibacillus xerothermodurans]PZE20604.1 C4-dicarboxylate ABC transporter substrate-binding protein [Paenibacillus xerothermodurans]
MRRKKGIQFTAILLLTASVLLAGCGGQPASTDTAGAGAGGQEAKTHKIKVANYFAENHPQNVALREKFKPLVEKNSNGTLKVEIYENNKLGAEKEFYDGVRNGTIEMGIPGLIMQADIEKIQVGEWPFLFKDFKHAKKVFEGPIGAEMSADMETKHGVKVLAWSANGFRMFSSSKPLNSMEDFKGFRVRFPNIPNYIALGKALGMTVSPLPISEVFTALEQKVVDGQDNPIATVRASGWYEVQKYVLESNHMFSPNMYIINKKFWDKLTPDQQKVLQDAAKESAAHEWKLLEESVEADKKFLQEKGLQFITPDDNFKKAMQDAAAPLYEEFYSKYPWAKEMVEKINKEAG